MNNAEKIITILLLSLGVVITRFLPFIIFPQKKEMPGYMKYLSKALPFSMIGLLAVYCLRNVTPTKYPFGAPEFISVIFIAALHVWKRNTLLSIGAGTALYMFLVQAIFV